MKHPNFSFKNTLAPIDSFAARLFRAAKNSVYQIAFLFISRFYVEKEKARRLEHRAFIFLKYCKSKY